MTTDLAEEPVPHSADPEDYRELAGLPTLAAEAEAWLRQAGGGAA